MNKISFALIFWVVLSTFIVNAQTKITPEIISGPMQGHTTHTDMYLWVLVHNAQTIIISLHNQERSATNQSQTLTVDTAIVRFGYYPAHFHFSGLLPDTRYEYFLELNGTEIKTGHVHTLKPPGTSDFSFVAGSCALLPESTLEDAQPGVTATTYLSTAKSGADFMIWLGDNLYFRNGDWKSYDAMFARYVRMRSLPPLNHLLETMPQYAIWDDHDFGYDNANSTIPSKDWALQLFKQFWANPAYGKPDLPGVFYSFQYQDAEFFLLDDRYYKRLNDQQSDGTLLGNQQWEWLTKQLQQSTATFKFIICGVQMLIENSSAEGLKEFPNEREQFLDMLQQNKIKGVILISGDRHFAEQYRLPRPTAYDLYEVTTSPLSSLTTGILLGTSKSPQLAVQKTRLKKANFAKFAISGTAEGRQCTVFLCNKRGKTVWQKTWNLSDLGY